MITLNIVLFVTLAALQILDTILTKTLIESGNGKEANPIMAKLMALFGLMPALIIFKACALAIVYYCIVYLTPVIVSICCLIAFNVLYFWVVGNNYKIHKKYKE